jgi:hypothetical protein
VEYGKAWPYYRVDSCYWTTSYEAQCAMTVWELVRGERYIDPYQPCCVWIQPPDAWYSRTGTVTATLYQDFIYRSVQGFVANF